MDNKKIGIASDHAGYQLKEFVIGYLDSKGYDVYDFGTNSEESCDYPDYAHPLAEALRPRIPAPAFVYYGREVWEQALAALLCGENLLLAGGKATGKNVLAENLAAEQTSGNPSRPLLGTRNRIVGTPPQQRQRLHHAGAVHQHRHGPRNRRYFPEHRIRRRPPSGSYR